MTPVIAAVEWGGDFEGALDPIGHLFNFPPIVEFSLFGLDLSINRTILIAWFMTLLCGLFFVAAFRKATVVPGKLQALGEAVLGFVREVALDIIGPKGLKFVPLLTTMFVFVFFMNIAKITPFLMLPPTSRIALPLFLAVIAWGVYIYVGIREQGFVHYFKGIMFPPGVPWPVYIILTPIELATILILRPFTLTVRLFANMVAGHILVVITLVTIHVFLYPRPGLPVGIAAFVAAPLVFAFELLIISLQAYIFVLLTAVYISSSMEAH